MSVTYLAKGAGKGEWIKKLSKLESYIIEQNLASKYKASTQFIKEEPKYTYSGKSGMVKTATNQIKAPVYGGKNGQVLITPGVYGRNESVYILKDTQDATLTKKITPLQFKALQKADAAEEKTNEDIKKRNEIPEEYNAKTENEYKNILAIVNSTNIGDYVNMRELIRKNPVLNTSTDFEVSYRQFYVNEKIDKPNQPKLIVSQPPYGNFDPKYYKETYTNVADAWQKYKKDDDVDIVERYAENEFYANHYTSQGKAQKLRANAIEIAKETEEYAKKYEPRKTTAEIQDIRDRQLGFKTTTQASRLMEDKDGKPSAIKVAWDEAKKGNSYWSKLAKEKYLDIDKPDDFLTLFRLSERPEDKEILKNAIGTKGGITELEDAFNQAVGAEALVETKKFGALAQDVLKETIAEMKKVKEKEQLLSLYKGLGGFSEIVDINKQLSNSILGDSGVGGILSQMGSTAKTEEDLEKKLENITGVRNNVVYNWEKWFDNTLKTKYGIDYSEFEPLEEKKDIIKAFTDNKLKESLFDVKNNQFNNTFLKSAGFDSSTALTEFLKKQGEDGLKILNIIKGAPVEESKNELKPLLEKIEADIKILDAKKNRTITTSYTTGDKTESLNIDAQFARNFIDEYLKPRFDTSRSMDEFREYIDVRQEEQNPFQTEALTTAVKHLADSRADEYLEAVQKVDHKFNADFYFNPTGDKSRKNEYAEQARTVAADWETAKQGDEYWAQQAYRYGIDINDKDSFARIHFQLIGSLPKDPNDPKQGIKFDGAEDATNTGKIQDQIYENILPYLSAEAIRQGSAFGLFETPEEFADKLLKGVDPADTEAWDKILKANGLETFKGTVDELKEAIKEVLRTGSAQTIRENIKYLNEKRERPTQEKLGITYIERTKDYKTGVPKSDTALYTTFQKAGYKGTEDDFYEKFFPDTDRSEQEYLTKALTGKSFEITGLTLSKDPFENLNTIEGMFPEEKEIKKKKNDDKVESPSQFFRLGLDDEDDEDYDYISKSGSDILGEFTKNFK